VPLYPTYEAGLAGHIPANYGMKSKNPVAGLLKKLSDQKELIGLLPITGFEIFFYLAPLAFLLIISFWMTKDYQAVPIWNLENYRFVFTDPLVRVAFFRSLVITLTTLGITILVAYPFAYGLVFKVPPKYRQLILIAIIAPFWTNYLVRSYSWQLILGGNGVINHLLLNIGIIHSPLNILYTHVATRIGLLHFLVTVMVLNLYGTLDSIDRSLIEAASDLGAGPFRNFFWITFPLSLPGLAIGTVFVFIFSFTDFIAPSVLGGGTKPVFSQKVVDAAHWTANYSLASALSMAMILASALFLLVIFRTVKTIIKDER
jgi:spermidine/putrescine transport system permease protein